MVLLWELDAKPSHFLVLDSWWQIMHLNIWFIAISSNMFFCYNKKKA
jgi:hypothetical protein